ncbi:MAG: (Fe-S)-binding protein [Desulfosporosinus sp.]|nr:(Fe-S)-binding protein [Desulfosporosinus sp.]
MVNINELQGMLDLCSRCGNCQQICPLYAEEKQETAVARGKLHLISLLIGGEINPSSRLQQILDFCLLCGRCSSLCQNGVPSDILIVLGRALVNQSIPKFKHKLIRYMLRKERMKYSFHGLYFTRKMRLDKPLQWVGKMKPYWPYYKSITSNLKKRPLTEFLPKVTEISQSKKQKVGYFIGCMNNFINQSVGWSTYSIITKLGFEVVVPDQKCCGMPAWTNGDLKLAEELVQLYVSTFNNSSVDFIVTDCASCGHSLKHLPEFFLKEEGRQFQAKVMDISEFLCNYLDPSFLRSYEGAISYHDPCHLRYGQKVIDQPRNVLRLIPDLELRELNDPGCCGFAGTFITSHMETTQTFGMQRAKAIIDSGVVKVITSCPACQLQLDKNLKDQENSVEVLNLVEFVDHLMK